MVHFIGAGPAGIFHRVIPGSWKKVHKMLDGIMAVKPDEIEKRVGNHPNENHISCRNIIDGDYNDVGGEKLAEEENETVNTAAAVKRFIHDRAVIYGIFIVLL